ncbi:MAG: hypothetical protein OER21_13030 [Gemmatimonadota bacterium]|nr:hypothetical protein [Gemmatimonadota bacterium]
MSATAFTVGVEATIAAAVRSYFTKFRVLPPRALVVSRTVTPMGPASFETLLRAMTGAQTTSFVIVVHGHEDGSGLHLKLANRGRAAVGEKTTHDKLRRLMTIAARSPASVSAEDRQQLGLRDAEIGRLIGLMQTLRGKNIRAIEFRGCNLGRNTNSVARFRAFFGTQSFGAPKLHSFFGLNPVGTGANLMRAHQRSHRGTTFTYSQTFAGKTCHCCIGVNDRRKPQNGHLVADDNTTVDAWIQANFDATATRGQERRLPIHGLWKFPDINLNDPDILGNLDPRPIFPLARNARNQHEYRTHVVYSP